MSENIVLRGTIDPDSGVFRFDFGSDPICGDDRIDGTVAANGTTMSGGESQPFFLHECFQAGGSFTGLRTGPLPTKCGDGLLDDPSEQCDDWNQTSGDCCSSSCQLEPAGAPCSDGNACTDDACDGAGTCQHVDNSGPCGTICAPGTCAAGQCAPGDQAPAGTPCDDYDVCTVDDRCNDRGFCLGTDTVTCGTCEVCDRAAGCVVQPQPWYACDADSTGVLTLSVAKAANPRLSWNRKDRFPTAALLGDPNVDTEYTLCVFDAAARLVQVTAPPASTCAAGPCWRATGSGFRYHDRTRSSGGLEQIDLQQKDAQHIDLKVTAKGPNLQLPASLAGVASPVIAELHARNPLGRCVLAEHLPCGVPRSEAPRP